MQGFPALSAAFERGQIRLPYREGSTREAISQLCGELNAIAFDDDKGKLEAAQGHDDLAHSMYIGFHELFFGKKELKVHSL